MKYRRLMMMLVSLAAVAAMAQPLRYDPKLLTGKLANGLTYYIYPNDNPKGEAVYRLFIKTGSLMEEDRQRGLAHFLEHMAFNGTRHFPGDGIVKFLESKGAKFGKDLNAHTSFTETVYKLQLPTTDKALVDSTLTILADWADGLRFDPAEVEKERGVILSEWLSRGGNKVDNNKRLLYELLNGSKYARRLTIGDTAIIRHFKVKDIRDYYEQWYDPSLMAIAVVGDIDTKAMLKLIKAKFAGLKSVKSGVVTHREPIPPYRTDAAMIAIDSTATKIELDLLQLLPFPGSVGTAQDYKPYLERSILNRLTRQRFNALSFTNPAYSDGSMQYSSFLNTAGITDGSVELVDGKIREGIADYMRHRQQLLRYGFTAAEIARVKKSLLRAMQNRVKSKQPPRSGDLMDEIYADFYNGNRLVSKANELALMERYLPEIDSLSLLHSLQRVFQTAPTHYLLRGGTMISDEIADSVALLELFRQAAQAPVERYYRHIDIPDELVSLQPQQHIISEKPIPEIGAVDLRLDNGVRVIFKPSPTDKDHIMVSGFRPGGQYAIDSLHYYTGLFSGNAVALSGAGAFSRDALSYFLTGNSASARLLVDKLRTGVFATSRLEDMETMFQLLYLKWTQARLDTATAELLRDKLIESYRTTKKTPEQIFGQQVGWLLNGRNYTNAEITDTLVTELVKTDDMLPLFNRFFGTADGYTFIVMGDCTLDDIRTYVSTYLGGLPGGTYEMPWLMNHRDIPHTPQRFIRHTGTKERANVMLVYQTDKPLGGYHETDIKGDIMSAVLRSMLLKRLREDMGKVYSVSVSASTTPYPSYLSRATIAFSCHPDDVDTLIRATEAELDLLYTQPGLFATVVEDVKKNLIKDHRLQIQQTASWSAWIRNAVYYRQEDWTAVTRYDDRVNAVTPTDVAEYAKKVICEAYRTAAILYPEKK